MPLPSLRFCACRVRAKKKRAAFADRSPSLPLSSNLPGVRVRASVIVVIAERRACNRAGRSDGATHHACCYITWPEAVAVVVVHARFVLSLLHGLGPCMRTHGHCWRCNGRYDGGRGQEFHSHHLSPFVTRANKCAPEALPEPPRFHLKGM